MSHVCFSQVWEELFKMLPLQECLCEAKMTFDLSQPSINLFMFWQMDICAKYEGRFLEEMLTKNERQMGIFA